MRIRLNLRSRWSSRFSVHFGLLSFLIACLATGRAAEALKPNILFIAVDDLNHWVGFMGRNPQTRTPNIDKLAARGVAFTRAYCAAPVCNPSRTAIMSGMRPSTTGVYDNGDDWRKVIPPKQTLPGVLRTNGYYVAGAGKIYHGGFDRREEWEEYMKGAGGDPAPTGDRGVGGIKFAPLDCKDEDLADYRITSWVISKLKESHSKPFFLACGLHKPHMPWNVPRKYFDLFPLDKIQLPPTHSGDLNDLPAGGVKMAKAMGDHAAILQSGRWKEAVQAYLAAIAYTDMNIGRLIEALDTSAYATNTIIVFWGDHGWHLGEKEHWRKFALWEEATRAPLIWVVPGLTKSGGVCARPVDFMHIFPTLTDLCGVARPQHVEGQSIRALLARPDAPWDDPALTTHGFNNHAVRSERWRYIRYADGGEELYDHPVDPYEWTNLASQASSPQIKQDLAKTLPKENKPALDAPRGRARRRAGN
jgi:arylsulfatase A-like enzyme